MPKYDCHPGRARSGKIRDRGVNAALAAVPDPRPASPGLSGIQRLWRDPIGVRVPVNAATKPLKSLA